MLRLLAEGMTATQIGRQLGGLSENTIKRHLRNLYARINAVNAAHAVKVGYRLGLLGPDAPTVRPHPNTLSHMDNQHRLISYGELSQHQIRMINLVKEASDATGEVWRQIRDEAMPEQEDLEAARRHLLMGYMLLTRAIAKPESW